MSLDKAIRGTLELLIDRVITHTAHFARLYQSPEVRSGLHIQNAHDFSFGIAVGMIVQEFSTSFIGTYGRSPSQQELFEVNQIIVRRMAEIRDAIFRAG